MIYTKANTLATTTKLKELCHHLRSWVPVTLPPSSHSFTFVEITSLKVFFFFNVVYIPRQSLVLLF